MTEIIQHHPTTAVAFPRAIITGVELRNVPFEDFTLEVREVEAMDIGKVEIIHQKAQPNVALQVVHTKDLNDFDRKLRNSIGMNLNIQYVKGDYTFMVIFSGIQGDFAKDDTDLNVQMHIVSDAVRDGARWYHLYKNKVSQTNLLANCIVSVSV